MKDVKTGRRGPTEVESPGRRGPHTAYAMTAISQVLPTSVEWSVGEIEEEDSRKIIEM
jgi:hypothetical protein